MQVHIQPRNFGWAWVGIFTLVVIGVSAVIYAEDHESDWTKRTGKKR